MTRGDELARGLYEEIVTTGLERKLADLVDLHVAEAPLNSAEAADRLALHVARIVERAIDSVGQDNRAAVGAQLARDVVEVVQRFTKGDLSGDAVASGGRILRSITGSQPDGSPDRIGPPLTPLLDTVLLSNSPGEPATGKQLASEIPSADSIDLVVAFIRRTGLRPLMPMLKAHRALGRPIRVLTTTYTNSTEVEALEMLADIGADVRVSYNTSAARLHAKAWIFHRDSGLSTAYIGSSNLTHQAHVTGAEWNLRVSAKRNRSVLDKIEAVFDSYWNGGDFDAFDPEVFRKATEAQMREDITQLSPIELRPEPFQERILEQLALARSRGHHRNLIVAATGTGKTVMAAVDYARLRLRLPRARLLFVAHRQEILEKSLSTFRHALRDGSFGELWVGGKVPDEHQHVFASIQSLNANGLESLQPDHFDIVIVDEFHHAAAASYQRLLERVRPVELLGLTATPERADGLSVLHHFDDRIAAELRLWEAIDAQRLTPFHYFGLADDMDLREVPWRRGSYDLEALSNVYTADDAWARKVVQHLHDHVDDPLRMRALGFCVSVSHAHFMAKNFNAAGIPAVAVSASTPRDERERALRDLADGSVNAVFSVDLFNEGVDIPSCDTLLMLRPTESGTLFLQQLGRGLRLSAGKEVCTVIDLVGQHRKEFRYDLRLRALFGGTRGDVLRQVESGFPYLPSGCHVELDRVSQERVLASIRQAIPGTWRAKVAELRAYINGGGEPRLASFLADSGLELTDVYDGNRSWSDFKEAAGISVPKAGPREAEYRRAIGRLTHMDDDQRIGTLARLTTESYVDLNALAPSETRVLRMLAVSLADATLTGERKAISLADLTDEIWQHQAVLAELRELLDLLAGHMEYEQAQLDEPVDTPLNVHARYTRKEILAALGAGEHAKTPEWREGVKWLPDISTDVFLVTLDKSDGSFSPSTRYRDYALSRSLFHWESQSTTSAESPTGQRYRNHVAQGSQVLLFARLNSQSRSFWFLGPATYQTHTGSRPMAITWRLAHPLPTELYQQFAAVGVA